MNKMKKITATAAAMAISAGLAVGGTLAYLNSVTETKTNTFTSGKNITTTLTETEWTTDSGKNYTPGDVIRKNPVMKNESDQAVYMAIKVDYTDAQGSLMSAEAFEKYASVTDFDLDDWEKIAVNQDGSEMWVYKSAVEAGSDADGNKLEIIDVDSEKYDPTVIYKDQDGNIVDAGTLPSFNIKVTGFAVQASTFADYEEAQPELVKLVNSRTAAGSQFTAD